MICAHFYFPVPQEQKENEQPEFVKKDILETQDREWVPRPEDCGISPTTWKRIVSYGKQKHSEMSKIAETEAHATYDR